MLMSPKNICFHFVIPHHPVNIQIIRPNDRKVKVVGVDRGGAGTKHRKCFFHGRDQIIKNITLNYTVPLKGNYSIK